MTGELLSTYSSEAIRLLVCVKSLSSILVHSLNQIVQKFSFTTLKHAVDANSKKKNAFTGSL